MNPKAETAAPIQHRFSAGETVYLLERVEDGSYSLTDFTVVKCVYEEGEFAYIINGQPFIDFPVRETTLVSSPREAVEKLLELRTQLMQETTAVEGSIRYFRQKYLNDKPE